MADIDMLSLELGIPWEKDKDVPFETIVPFIDFSWNIISQLVLLPPLKKTKYLVAITKWNLFSTHNLMQMQKLYGKLLHTCHIIPKGKKFLLSSSCSLSLTKTLPPEQAFLTSLKNLLGQFDDHPFMPCSPSCQTPYDLIWWTNLLRQPTVECSFHSPYSILDITTYSDTSSEVGIGIIIGQHWRTQCLLPEWKANGCDIGWTEAVGTHNTVIYTRYVCSKNNLADGPS